MSVRLLHLISGLEVGGAELMLARLAASLASRGFEQRVISLTTDGPTGDLLRSAGIRVEALGLRRTPLVPLRAASLLTALRRERPDVLQTWMYHADLLGGLAAKASGRIPVAWGIRTGTLDPLQTRRTTLWVRAACARLSRVLPSAIVSCSQRAAELHVALGYDGSRLLVIPNGFDCDKFRPDPEAPASVRQELDVRSGELLVGVVGRFDPQKDHRGVLAAAARVVQRVPNVRFLLVGEGLEPGNPAVSDLVRQAGLGREVLLLGRRRDVPRLTAALDLAVLGSSHGEGFPNVLGEAMSCAVPCVSTDVGDAAHVLGETGAIVAPRDPAALADAVCRLLGRSIADRQALGAAARRRVLERFSLPVVAESYARLYGRLASGEPPAGAAGEEES